jgi:hypothetical protein
VKLHADVDALKQEKAKVVTDHEADLAAKEKKFLTIVLATAASCMTSARNWRELWMRLARGACHIPKGAVQ